MHYCVPIIRGKPCALLIALLWSALIGHGQTGDRTVGSKSRFRHLKSSFILSLASVLMFWHPVAKAQFIPIPLSGGALVKMTADYQRPCIYAIQAPASGATKGRLL